MRSAPQRVAVKTRLINHGKYRRKGGAGAAIQDEIAYLRRRGASQDGEQGVAFDRDGTLAGEELQAFRDRMAPDRHHFRIVVSPEQGAELELPPYTRVLMEAMQKDLGTSLQWFGVAHYDTDNPHVHLILRGRDDRGRDLVISRDYISHGMRLQAGEVATRILGPRRVEDIEQSLERDLKAERVTVIDRHLDRQRAGHPEGLVSALRGQRGDLAREPERIRTLARLEHLESLGLAREVSAGLWQPDPQLLERLKALSLRGDIVKTIHARMTGKPYALDPLILKDGAVPPEGLIGRVTAKARVDEFWDAEYVLLDSNWGRTVYLPLDASDARSAIGIDDVIRVEAGRGGRLAVTRLAPSLLHEIGARSVAPIDAEIARRSGSIPDRQTSLTGFAGEYERAIQGRLEHLSDFNLAQRSQGRWRVHAGFLDELYAKELQGAEERLRSRFGERKILTEGAAMRGTVRTLEALPSGPHAVVEHAGRYALIPANAALERSLHRPVQIRATPLAKFSAFEPRARQWSFEVASLTRAHRLGRP